MGYGVNAPTKYAKEYTEVELAIRAVEGPGAAEALTIISKLSKNVYQNPKEEKYRKIRLSNPKIDATIVQVPGAMQLLIAMGWKYDVDVDADNLILPPAARLNFQAHVRPCDERVEELAKLAEKAMLRQACCQPKTTSSSNSNTIDTSVRAQLEADRKERAAADPITRSSVATARGSGTQVGCGDVGIGCDSGG